MDFQVENGILFDYTGDLNVEHLVIPEGIGRCRIHPVPTEELLVLLRQGGAE